MGKITKNILTDQVVDVNMINPVDYYNRNCVEHTIELLVKQKSIERVGIKALTYVKNRSDKTKRMIIIDDATGEFEAELPNGLNMPVGERYTAFMMLQKYVMKNSWRQAMNYATYTIMNNKNEYVRIRTDYFIKMEQTDRYGVQRSVIEPWTRQALLDDFDKTVLDSIEKFKGFTIVPDNKNFKQTIGNKWNLYAPFDYKPLTKAQYKGDDSWQWTRNLLQHIFGKEQYHMGLIYLKVLYDHPTQALPILVPISEERQTGKTTFVNYMNILFGANTVIINPQDISSSFNASYAEKNIIMIEESHFDSRQAQEKIKNLSTQKLITINQKHIAQKSIAFFGKLIITSNDETKFSKVDEAEIRYWVRKVPTLVGKENHNILMDMKDEIPAFLYYLDNIGKIEGEHQKFLKADGSVDLMRHRMVFKDSEITTTALTTVKKESRETLHKDIEIYLDNHGMQNPTIEKFYFISINIKEKWFSHNQRYSTSYINRVLKSGMKLEKNEDPMRFVPIEDESLGSQSMVGRPYIYKNKFYNSEPLTDESDPGIAF